MEITLFLTSNRQMDLERISHEDSIVPNFNPSDGFREDISYGDICSIAPNFNPSDGFRKDIL